MNILDRCYSAEIAQASSMSFSCNQLRRPRSLSVIKRWPRWGLDMKIRFLGGIENLKMESVFFSAKFLKFLYVFNLFCIFLKYKNVQQLSEVSRNSDKIQWKSRRKMTDDIILIQFQENVRNSQIWSGAKECKSYQIL